MDIFWIRIDKLKYNEFLTKILSSKEQNIIFTPNPEILLKVRRDDEFRNILSKATYLLPDWIWLYIAFQVIDNNYWKLVNFLLIPYYFFNLFFRKKYLYLKYWDRICGSDLTRDLIEYANKNSKIVNIVDLFNPTDLKKVASQNLMKLKLKEKYPNAIFNIYIYREEKKNEIISNIKDNWWEILLTTLWMKYQEQVLLDVIKYCNNIKIWAWIWSSIDYLIWFQKRAPKLWSKLWLEWLYRLITWPRKIDRIKRIYNAIFVFIFTVLINKNND